MDSGQEKLTKGDKSLYFAFILFCVILVFTIISTIFYCGASYADAKRKNEDYKYYDKFCQYLKCNSQAYDDCTEEFMKKEYESWLNNTGYGDIIIDIDGNLTSIYTDEGY